MSNAAFEKALLWPDVAATTIEESADDDSQEAAIEEIEDLDRLLKDRFARALVVNPSLTRQLVSFQANKTQANFRWYKFKEAFSALLIDHLLEIYKVTEGPVLDPFAGSGTTLFVASGRGITSEGIEVLPTSQQLILSRLKFEAGLSPKEVERLRRWEAGSWKEAESTLRLPELRITQGAYPPQTKREIERYLTALRAENGRVESVLRYALFSVLEIVSYTRKDGQYLRWDHRSGRRQGKKPFDKGNIPRFAEAISHKIGEILHDLTDPQRSLLFDPKPVGGEVSLHAGSCLDILPALAGNTYTAVITSPPYCNRYDYTRTYALELALLGVGEKDIVDLRQKMLSCTVENRAKDLIGINPAWKKAIAVTDKQEPLQTILKYLEGLKDQKKLNNNGIPRMVRGYFYEMACVIAECGRILKPGAPLLMVNVNVRYAGASVSVDLILSDLAGSLGFTVESILVLPGGKGNSSQQMGRHGREPLRKCIYVWRKN